MSTFKLQYIGFLVVLGFLCSLNSAEKQESECIVFVTNNKYFPKFLKSLKELVTKGNYHGDVCLVIRK